MDDPLRIVGSPDTRHLLTIMRFASRAEFEKRLERHERAIVRDVLEAVQEHLACACNGIEGHLRTRGLTRG